ncbi:MAG: hypothetical protein HFI92_09075 [Lachnospiraceae bacterium]|nr:hypothetical protein [Lachnospiraceae bacterium]
MTWRCKKVENCFAGASTYEYELPVTGQELLAFLEGWEIRENHKFRRPVFSAKRGPLEIKGILAAHVVKVNYPADTWKEEKERLERWLEQIKQIEQKK